MNAPALTADQLALFPDFDGQTYEARHDHGRLARQLAKVRILMSDGNWRTLATIAEAVGSPEASVSARLRDLRKPKFGAYIVDRRSCGARARGLYEYRLSFPARTDEP